MKPLVRILAGLFIICFAAGLAAGQNPPPTPPAAKFFSLNIATIDDPWPTQLGANFGVWRTIGANLTWNTLEPCQPSDETNPSDPCYQWNSSQHLDKMLSAAAQNGQDVLFTAFYTPQWASMSPNTSCAPNRSLGGCYPPADVDSGDVHWKNFLTALYKHVSTLPPAGGRQPHIKYWECWNEPDIDTEFYTAESTGLAQLNQLCQDLRATIHPLDATAKFTTPAPTSVQGVANWMKIWAAAGYTNDADYVAFHGYLCSNIGKCYSDAEAVVTEVIDPLRAAIATTPASRLPLWDTEGGLGDSDPNPNPDVHAAFVTRFLLMQQSAGVSTVSYFGWDFSNISLINNPGAGNGTLNAAGVAWQQLYDWTVGQGVRHSFPCTNTSGTIYQCKMPVAGKTDLIVWDISQTSLPCPNGACGTTPFSVPAGYTEFDDLAGNVNQPISGGVVDIGSKPILLH